MAVCHCLYSVLEIFVFHLTRGLPLKKKTLSDSTFCLLNIVHIREEIQLPGEQLNFSDNIVVVKS